MIQYLRVAEQIRTSLQRGVWQDGAAIAPEAELCDLYGVSRTTVRAALRELEREGLIYRERGRGTFVRLPGIAKDLGSLVDFHTEAIAAGHRPSTHVLSLGRRKAELHEIALFGAGVAGAGVTGAGVAELGRLRCLDDEPAVLQRSVLPAAFLDGLGTADLANRSLYRLLSERKGIDVADIEETLEPWSLGEEDAAHLALPPGTAVFRSQRIARRADGSVVELSDNLIRGDRYRFHVKRRARAVWS